ncbi:hypothetical protein RZN05_06520 [Sphingomonas sp. HF-S4]|uniref:DUF4124 domain-containing protein n=1 Tax=Sphingomonas agrestis TaxID=3080540 RepID=A0ABU3Y5D8_9SPHN|nr:hypothetical protein [Sphingomonas sp. HF-S4]MDV3456634.1 hypothetical protein [Sphingomonas sp. HF-S4]
MLSFLFAALIAGPALPQDSAQGDGPPQRVRSILLYGDEQCPKAQSEDEIVVCANAGESPYRIPKRFREQPKEGPASNAWTNRVESVEQFNRAGLPNSCSPVGSGGQTGCTRAAIRQWYQERVDQKAKAARVQGPAED